MKVEGSRVPSFVLRVTNTRSPTQRSSSPSFLAMYTSFARTSGRSTYYNTRVEKLVLMFHLMQRVSMGAAKGQSALHSPYTVPSSDMMRPRSRPSQRSCVTALSAATYSTSFFFSLFSSSVSRSALAGPNDDSVVFAGAAPADPLAARSRSSSVSRSSVPARATCANVTTSQLQ